MLYLPIFISIFSLVFAYFLIKEVKKASSGSGKQIEIAKAIKEGAAVFLKRQYLAIGAVAVFLFFFLWLVFSLKVASGFLAGAVVSSLVGLIGMLVSTQASLKVVEAAKSGLSPAFDLSFKGGSVTGFLVTGLGTLVVYGFYLLTKDLLTLVALCFGVSLIAIFSRIGGGIYTKAADVGADSVGKIEKGISENDPRNPAVIADQVGDSVGNCVGAAGDMFQTYVIALVAAMILGVLIFPGQIVAVVLPPYLASMAILASIISAYFFIKLRKNQNPTFSLYRGLIISGILSAASFYPIISRVAPLLELSPISLYLSAVIGLLIAAGTFLITYFFTSKKYWPVKSITKPAGGQTRGETGREFSSSAEASRSGHDPNIIAGLAVGMKSTIWPVILISIGILISFNLAGIYGLAIAAVAMLSLVGLIVALSSYVPITGNASGIAEMAGLPEFVRKNIDSLGVAGNTTKAMIKGYAISSAGLAVLALFSVYTQQLLGLGKKAQFFLEDPRVLVGLFFGGIIVHYLASLAVSLDYKTQLKETILPIFLPLLFPVFIGFILGPEALGGFLIGSIVVGIFLAIKMTTAGAAWDNAKKWIEEGNLGGKRSLAHQSVFTGDTVGGGYKDAVGLAINPMIKVLTVVALLIVGFLI